MSFNKQFTWPVRVYYEDTDAGGVVFYANYLKYLERARTEWLRSLGFDQSLLIETADALFAVVSVNARYRQPARLDDELDVGVLIADSGRSSIGFIQEIHRKRDGVLLFSAEVKVACLSASAFKPRAIPQEIREMLGS